MLGYVLRRRLIYIFMQTRVHIVMLNHQKRGVSYFAMKRVRMLWQLSNVLMVSHSNNDHLRPLLFTGSNDTTLHTYKHTYLCLIDVTMHVSHPLYTCMDTKHISARVMTTLISLTHKQTNKQTRSRISQHDIYTFTQIRFSVW